MIKLISAPIRRMDTCAGVPSGLRTRCHCVWGGFLGENPAYVRLFQSVSANLGWFSHTYPMRDRLGN